MYTRMSCGVSGDDSFLTTNLPCRTYWGETVLDILMPSGCPLAQFTGPDHVPCREATLSPLGRQKRETVSPERQFLQGEGQVPTFLKSSVNGI